MEMYWLQRKKIITTILAYVIVILATIIAIGPIVAGFITAFKPGPIQIASPPVWVFTPTLDNFKRILIEKENYKNLFNSAVVTGLAVAVSLLVGVPAGYGMARFPMKGGRSLLSWIISLRMIPPVVVAIPFFVLFQTVKLYDTHLSLILAYLTFCIPVTIWIMRGFFAEIPNDLEESAMVDGCTRMGAFRRVVLPVIIPGMVACSLLVLMLAWNEYLLALVLTGGSAQTMPVAAARYITRTRVEWGELFSANMLIAVPVIALAYAMRRQLVRGMAFGMIE
jgi:multiple sugar transport system permease protein